jgi:hypothetical protein
MKDEPACAQDGNPVRDSLTGLLDINPRMPLKLVIEEAHDDVLHDLESHGGGRKDEHM